MILIGSADYIGQDLSIEVGRLPPAFLPVGNRRLYEYQVELLESLGEDIFLSIPESFDLPSYDAERLGELAVRVIRVPDGLSLGNSVVYCWSASGVEYQSLTLLHGDTLFLNIELGEYDSLSAHLNVGSYHRARISACSCNCSEARYASDFVDDERLVLSGYFRFTKPQLLMQGILQGRGDFIAAIEHYTRQQQVTQISDGLWLDFGHLNSFFNSRSLITTQRSFNSLHIEPRKVTKSSSKKIKMRAESNWFKSLPKELHIHIPPLLHDYSESESSSSYSVEYLYLMPLSDIYVFGSMSKTSWRNIFTASFNVLRDMRRGVAGDCDLVSANQLYLPKTLERLQSMSDVQWRAIVQATAFAQGDNLLNIAKIASSYVSSVRKANIAIVHGDFCFSNILFDTRTAALKLIDPRGMNCNGDLSIYGDQRYDVAKLYHSVVGRYDFIIAGRYRIIGDDISFPDESRVSELEKLFDSVFFCSDGFDKTEILAINVLLFLSMIPLHSDRQDRQHAMLLNAYKLFRKLMETPK